MTRVFVPKPVPTFGRHALEDALDASENRDKESQTRISDLGRRLNVALARKVQELERYRSDFFGRLRKILGDRENVRVDGHTDIKPIRNAKFPSNWELSSARAISVVRQLLDAGVPPKRLVAAGFGEFQPLDTGDEPDSLRKNRRIELKLTEK